MVKCYLPRGLRNPCGTEEARARLPGSSTALIGVKAACDTEGRAAKTVRVVFEILHDLDYKHVGDEARYRKAEVRDVSFRERRSIRHLMVLILITYRSTT